MITWQTNFLSKCNPGSRVSNDSGAHATITRTLYLYIMTHNNDSWIIMMTHWLGLTWHQHLIFQIQFRLAKEWRECNQLLKMNHIIDDVICDESSVMSHYCFYLISFLLKLFLIIWRRLRELEEIEATNNDVIGCNYSLL